MKYTLYGVLVHCGWSTRSGHYYCFVRTSSGMWYSLDDNRVLETTFPFRFFLAIRMLIGLISERILFPSYSEGHLSLSSISSKNGERIKMLNPRCSTLLSLNCVPYCAMFASHKRCSLLELEDYFNLCKHDSHDIFIPSHVME